MREVGRDLWECDLTKKKMCSKVDPDAVQCRIP